MGATTYEWILANDSGVAVQAADLGADPSPRDRPAGHPVQAYQGDVTELHPQLVAAAGYQDVWVVGGGDAAAQFARRARSTR